MKKQTYDDRTCIFRGFTTDEFENVREELMDKLLTSQYDEFVEKCEYIKANKANIEYISCELIGDKLQFTIKEKERSE